ncbi:NAD-dependent epimerase/dehydratase family protein [archaeon]|jgi:nucleoside-diphosphate-sugar epimerase|nr:NAD-dependent epimerase/dehydratase family protein [archaeon]
MKNILITGGAGCIGSSLVHALLDNGNYFVQVVDNLSTGNIDNLPDHCNFTLCDVNNYSEISLVMQERQFDIVFHYAAIVGVKRTQENPLKVLDDINGIKNILELSVKTKVKRVFYSSSSEVYGEPVSLPQNEATTPLNSRVPYAIVKNIGEAFFRSYYKEFDLKYTIFRFFNTYGPSQSDDFVVSRFINKALNNEDICIYGDGKQSRTFLYINDNIDFTMKIISEDLLINDTINIGNNKMIEIKELAKIIKKVLKSKSKIKYIEPLKEGDMSRRQPDISKMLKLYKNDLTGIESGVMNIYRSLKR